MLSSVEQAQTRITAEASESDGCYPQQLEELDGDFCRVGLCVLSSGLSPRTLAKLFCLSAEKKHGSLCELESKLDVAQELICRSVLPFELSQFKKARELWRASGYPAPRHSESFRNQYRPSYRVISKEYVSLLPLLSRLDLMLEASFVNLAIDGGSASGKSTLAALLADIYDATVFHMDDYFLRPEQRTARRLAEAGGNVDRERFKAEILDPLSQGSRSVTYRPYDCSVAMLSEPITVIPKELCIIEGVYSMHPELSSYYDLSVFLEISDELQRKRIEIRESPDSAKRFAEEWIPMEKRYFNAMSVKERCDISIENES